MLDPLSEGEPLQTLPLNTLAYALQEPGEELCVSRIIRGWNALTPSLHEHGQSHPFAHIHSDIYFWIRKTALVLFLFSQQVNSFVFKAKQISDDRKNRNLR